MRQLPDGSIAALAVLLLSWFTVIGPVYESHRRDWCSQVTMLARDATGRSETFVSVIDDVSELRRQAERAAHIRRQLLPTAALPIEGYELVDGCQPAQPVAGDFYDWVATPDGRIDITLANVMGKGMGAALVMATLRAVLRSAPPSFEPAARVTVAAEALVRGLTDEGLFVTMFHARLDLTAGWLSRTTAPSGEGRGRCGRTVGGLACEPTSLP